MNPFTQRSIEWWEPPPPVKLQVRPDHAKTLLVKQKSPDLSFEWSANLYRGCTHACAYCYARRNHEFLELNAGEDFERILFAKMDAPALFDRELRKTSWKGEWVMFSGVTDTYQPLERKLGLMRACLQVARDFRQPVAIITRSALVMRDVDLLGEMASWGGARVMVSVPVGDEALVRALEPGASPLSARFRAIRELSEAGVPVGVSLAPMIVGLSDHLIPSVLQRAAEGGATSAFMGRLRLSEPVAQVFAQRMAERLPLKAAKVARALEDSQTGAAGHTAFGARFEGQGPRWQVVKATFDLWCRKLGLNEGERMPCSPGTFRVPGHGRQLGLF